MDFRKLHVIIGELEFDNIKLAAKGDKQALNILALTKSFRELEHKYRKLSEGNHVDLKNAALPIFDVIGRFLVNETEKHPLHDIEDLSVGLENTTDNKGRFKLAVYDPDYKELSVYWSNAL